MNKLEIDILKKIIYSENINSLFNVKLVHGFQSLFLYPTNDLRLTEKQFTVLKNFLKTIGESEFYFTQFDGSSIQQGKKFNGIFSETNPVYKFDLNCKYSDYCEPFLYSVSVLFSIKGSWAILIDETFDAGYGIFMSSQDYLDKFKELYEPIKTEYREWMDDKRYEEDVKYYKGILIANGVIN